VKNWSSTPSTMVEEEGEKKESEVDGAAFI
jgi:hypothetical protein